MPKKTARKSNGGGSSVRPPFILQSSKKKASFSKSFDAVANLLKGKKNIIVLTGAGISVSCGIPDFRSKGSGLYSTLDTERLGLSCAEELFDWEVFQEDPRPFFRFARNLYFPLGDDKRVEPSDSHRLLALLEKKRMLLRVYSQNIDGLEVTAGVSSKRMVYAHGSLQWASCCRCKRKVTCQEIEPAIRTGTVPKCQAPAKSRRKTTTTATRTKRPKTTHGDDDEVCNGVLKPGVTFFGESLQDNVRRCLESDRDKVDALVVIGTSLSVAPMSKVIEYLPPNIPRILINRTIVHPSFTSSLEDDSDEEEEIDFRQDYVFDAYLLGFCDDVTRALAKKLFDDDSSVPKQQEDCGKLLNHTSDEEGWSSIRVPKDRVFLFPGACAPDDDASELTYREIAHCDGCSCRIEGMIRKCLACFDYDLCEACYPSLSKTHCDGQHEFSTEPASKPFETD